MTKTNPEGVFEVYPATPYRYKMMPAKELSVNSWVIIDGRRAVLMSKLNTETNILNPIFGKSIKLRYDIVGDAEYQCYTYENVPFCAEV